MATATQSSCQKSGGVTLREASWLMPGGEERSKVFLSLNAFALKHVSLFKEEHSTCLDGNCCICKTCIGFAQIFRCC